MSEETKESGANADHAEPVTDAIEDASFDIYKDRILGGDIFISVHPQISILQDDNQTIIATIIFEKFPQDGDVISRSCNIFDMSNMMNNLADGMLRGLEGMDKSRGRLLSMPGERDYNIHKVQETKERLDKIVTLLNLLLK